MGMKSWLTLVAYLFVAIASIIAIFRPEGMIWIIVFVLSAVVSLILAITRMLKNKKMAEKIRKLEEKQLSVRYDKGKRCVVFEQGVK